MSKRCVPFIALAFVLFVVPAMAGEAPSIGGAANITANIKGAITNAGGALSGGTATAKQAVASVLSGTISGSLQDTVSVKGAIVNVSGALSGGTATACQSVGTIGSDCGD